MILRKYEMSGAWQAQVIVEGQALDLKISTSESGERAIEPDDKFA
jgi:hypothetical protein